MFDLQRFAETTSDSSAIKFVVTRYSPSFKVTYYDDDSDFTTENLSGAYAVSLRKDLTLQSDVDTGTCSVSVTGSNSPTLDLNGHTLNLGSRCINASGTSASLTIKDSTATTEPVVSDDYSTVTYTAGKIKSTGVYVIEATKGVTVTLESGIIDASEGTYGIKLGNFDKTSVSNSSSGNLVMNGGYIQSKDAGIWTSYESTAQVSGGVISAANNGAIMDNGKDGAAGTNGSTVTVSGGTLIGNITSSGYVSVGIYRANKGTLNVTGGKIVSTSGAGIVARAGTVNISDDAEIIALKGSLTEGGVGDSNQKITAGDAIVFDTRASSYPGLQDSDMINISGGKLTGDNLAIQFLNAGEEDETVAKRFNVTGGIFQGGNDNTKNYVSKTLPDGVFVAESGEYLVVGSEGWYLGDENGITKWNLLEKTEDGTTETTPTGTVVAFLTGANNTLTLTTSGTTETVELDVSKVIQGNDTYTTLTASNVTLPLKITGDSKIKKITGGAGNDSLTAGTNGATLEGGAGNDVLVGSTGVDNFIYSEGADVVQNYGTGDSVSLETGLAATNSITGTSDDYTLTFGTGKTLNFKSAKVAVSLASGTDTYVYTNNSVAKGTGISLTAGYTDKKFDADTYTNVDASAVTVEKFAITGNDSNNLLIGGTGGGTLDGGEKGDDTLVGGAGADTFVFNGGQDVIKGYGEGDIVTLGTTIYPTEDGDKISAVAGDFQIDFGNDNKLTFNEDVQATVRSDSNVYVYAKDSVAKNNSITLAAGHASVYSLVNKDFTVVDATKVSQAISLVGNTDANTITASSVVGGNSLNGGVGNDLLKGYGKGDVFIYSGKSGRDSIEGFSANDSLSVDAGAIKSGLKNNNGTLTFKIDSSNTITFTGDVEKVKLAGEDNASLTKDGTIAGNTLTLFADQKGKINLKDTAYDGITGINASNVKSAVVTMIGDSIDGGTFTFAANKKADVFQYGGGAATLSNYVSDSDKIDLGAVSLSSFAVDSANGVNLTLSDGKTVSLQGENFANKDVLIKDSQNRSYKKYVFAETGVLYDKAKSPTTATLFNGAGGADSLYTAANSIKKIVADSAVSGISIQAGSGNNTFIDASAAGAGVTLVSNTKNDKFTGGIGNDTFIFTAGKDVITNYNESDSIVLDGAFSLGSAKITKSKKSVTLKFDSKNKLTIKADSGNNIGDISIGGQSYAFSKNAIITESGTKASLTNEFSGTYKVSGSVATVDGSAVTKKNFTIQGTSKAESLVGGSNKKTTLKGGGGNDTLVGGTGADTFFYAKSDKDNAQVYNFDYAKDQVKMKGTITGITKESDGLKFTTSTGSLTLKQDDKNNPINAGSNVLIKANNTLYWFDTVDGKYGLYTSTDKEVKSDIKSVMRDQDNYSIVDLNYSANLVKKGLATASKTVTFSASNYRKV